MRLINEIDVTGKKVLVRVDLNVPMKHGKIEDATRIEKIIPTLKYLLDNKARVIVISHFGRPQGFDPSMSLAPLADALSLYLGNMEVVFGVDSIGNSAKEAVTKLQDGKIALLENLRFHRQEEENDREFAKALASLADIYVNDSFSCSHRAHASITGVTEFLPSYAGFLLHDEVANIQNIILEPQKPIAAIIGGSKISTKLELLENLVQKMDMVIIGGAMANTFLKAKGYDIGSSLYEPELVKVAAKILENKNCDIILPIDVIISKEIKAKAQCRVILSQNIPVGHMIVDIGPKTISLIEQRLSNVKTVIWNGPMGVFEQSPFDIGTSSVARIVAALTAEGKILSIAGGGDSVAAISHAGLFDEFSYISTAGGAFLEWLEGKELPGILKLNNPPIISAEDLG